jgi:hypothetical protein
MPDTRKIERFLWIVVILSTVIRGLIAGFIEFGNDEVYYWTYARFPALSHFDHPPMVGLVIQLFTLNLHFDSEFFIRLGPVIFGAVNTWLIYKIGSAIKNPLTGLYAALLYTASFYCFVISGIFIMPDTPQGLFWLLSLYLLLKSLPDKTLLKASRTKLLLAGVTIGLAMLSKYHSVFLVAGTFLYILFYNRRWFLAKETWIALGMAIVLFSPVLIWNWQNSFITFTFHEGRFNPVEDGIRWDYFGREVAGQVFYNNPVNFVIIVITLIALIRGKRFLEKESLRLVLLISAPLAAVFLLFSLFSGTLPHWTGPAYYGFILLAAAWLSERSLRMKKVRLVPGPVMTALVFMLVLVISAASQVRYGWVPFRKWQSDDLTAQLYGWKQLGEKFSVLAQEDEREGIMSPRAPIFTFRWFPAANFDYYVARPDGKKVYALGTLTRIHKYYWIDKERGNLPKGTDAYYIALSDDFTHPDELYGRLFDSIGKPDTLPILRGNELVRKAFVYRLYGLNRNISFTRLTDFTEPSLARIRYWTDQINAQPAWLEQVKEKAAKQGRPLDEMIEIEAKYAAEEEMKK